MSSQFRLIGALLILALASVTASEAVPAARKRAARNSGIPAGPASALKASATVRRWMKTMTLRDEVAQLVFIPFHGAAPNSRTREYRTFMRLIRETKVGGLLLVNSGPTGGCCRRPDRMRWAPF